MPDGRATKLTKMTEAFSAKLREYARLAVRGCVNLQEGQELIVAADISDKELVRHIVTEAYRAGAKNVHVLYTDEANALSRYENGSDEAIGYSPSWLFDGIERALKEGGARIVVHGGDPSLLKAVAPEKVARSSVAQAKATEGIASLTISMAVNWTVIGAASPKWAKQVYPDLPESEGTDRLWAAIFSMSRMDAADPTAAWKAHLEGLANRCEQLNALNLEAVRFKGPGTDLKVGLACGAKWMGGPCKTQGGLEFAPNNPTEEVFSCPHLKRVEGMVSSTKPLSVRGQVVEGIRMEFQDGKATKISADRGEETLAKLLATDEGASRLGEVALVPHSSPVSKTGTLFYNTLYDENAACHVAMGRAYKLEGLSEAEKTERGFNYSLIHVDWMIGSGETDVDGIRGDGSVVPLLRCGEWARVG